jgi:hypothetical protein
MAYAAASIGVAAAGADTPRSMAGIAVTALVTPAHRRTARRREPQLPSRAVGVALDTYFIDEEIDYANGSRIARAADGA